MKPVDFTETYLTSLATGNDYRLGDHPQALAALPDDSLTFLVDLCQQLNIKRIFEFGSGRSTKAFLSIGCTVVSLEDSDYWMNQTLDTLSPDELQRHTAIVKPLTKNFSGSFPVLDWSLDETLRAHVKNAELVLIDSPYYTPYREATLRSSLSINKHGLIIIDDTRIPTVQKFCDKLATDNPFITHVRVPVGHKFDIFYKKEKDNALTLNHSILDTLKGWRRYFLGLRFYKELGSK